jgi:hypothetical protein
MTEVRLKFHTLGKTSEIIKNGDWYNFELIPQEHRYIKICNLCCKTDRKAINQARKIIGNPQAKVIVRQYVEDESQ